MKPRETVLQIPNRKPYVSVSIPNRDDHWLQIPSHLAAAQLLSQVPEGVLGQLAGLSVDEPSSAFAVVRAAGVEALSAVGALVGMAWAHPRLALECEAGADLMAFGAAAYEELHAEGYTLSEIVLLGLIVLHEVFEGAEIEREVQERIAFFGRAPEAQS